MKHAVKVGNYMKLSHYRNLFLERYKYIILENTLRYMV